MDILPILSTLRRHKITAFLVIIEIALTCAIVCNAVFIINQRLDRMNMQSGVDEHRLLHIELADIGVTKDQKARMLEDLAALRQIPGVVDVASVNEVPFGRSSSNSGIKLDLKQNQPTLNATLYSGENLRRAFGAQLVAGRDLQSDEFVDFDDVVRAAAAKDMKSLPHAVVITESMAQRMWPGQSALGKQFYLADFPITVVGVVKELVRPSIWDDNARSYSLVLPMREYRGEYVLRTASPQNNERVLAAALAKLKEINPHRVVLKKHSFDDLRYDFFQNDRAMAGLLIGVCVALLVVTSLGIVGLGSFWVAQRRRQIGVRRALGATRRNILNYFQTENFLLATIGIALGMVLAYGINLLLMTHYELPRLPAIYFPVGALLLWTIGQLAVLGPAMRAAAVPPVVATRSV
ncbi:ABC transporter permease [Dyella solisilvae]|uniref:ABC transporter permease n=1 Tax=Dyella solisilvae TaxID=1920168 RepID=A0A370KCD4_9GAMM|nr:FtsX-like permease family protein [Dyella solisilvae]RDJ00260.1 ABC transporter permease [Dyella solisilvae]